MTPREAELEARAERAEADLRRIEEDRDDERDRKNAAQQAADDAEARAEKLEAALRRLLEFVRIQDPRNSTERYELIADAFTKETGHVAPGRSMPPAMAYLPDDDDRRHVLWRGFCNHWHEAAYDSALAAAREALNG